MHGYAWATVVQNDNWLSLVERILNEFSTISAELVDSKDLLNRKLIDIASPLNQQMLQKSKYIFNRYELTSTLPHYKVNLINVICSMCFVFFLSMFFVVYM